VIAVGVDEPERFIGESVGQVVCLVAGEPIEFERGVVSGFWPALEPILGHLHVEALREGACLRLAKVPFAEMTGAVSVPLEGLGKGRFAERQRLMDARLLEPLKWEVLPPREPVGEFQPGRVFAGEDAGAGG